MLRLEGILQICTELVSNYFFFGLYNFLLENIRIGSFRIRCSVSWANYGGLNDFLLENSMNLNRNFIKKSKDADINKDVLMFCSDKATKKIRNPTIFNIIWLLVCWVAATNDSLTKRHMFQVLSFFVISYKILCKIRFNLSFYNKIFKKLSAVSL